MIILMIMKTILVKCIVSDNKSILQIIIASYLRFMVFLQSLTDVCKWEGICNRSSLSNALFIKCEKKIIPGTMPARLAQNWISSIHFNIYFYWPRDALMQTALQYITRNWEIFINNKLKEEMTFLFTKEQWSKYPLLK